MMLICSAPARPHSQISLDGKKLTYDRAIVAHQSFQSLQLPNIELESHHTTI